MNILIVTGALLKKCEMVFDKKYIKIKTPLHLKQRGFVWT